MTLFFKDLVKHKYNSVKRVLLCSLENLMLILTRPSIAAILILILRSTKGSPPTKQRGNGGTTKEAMMIFLIPDDL